ncbi:MAG: hypothetical protein CMJ90_12375 [Planctomycetes bacterium]|nr:hypothetical protein [Planctomycetota bacterium]
MNVNDAMSTVKDVAAGAISLGLSLVGLFLVVEVLYPDAAVGVVGNIGKVVGQFSGLNGLITLLILVAVMPKGRPGM